MRRAVIAEIAQACDRLTPEKSEALADRIIKIIDDHNRSVVAAAIAGEHNRSVIADSVQDAKDKVSKK